MYFLRKDFLFFFTLLWSISLNSFSTDLSDPSLSSGFWKNELSKRGITKSQVSNNPDILRRLMGDIEITPYGKMTGVFDNYAEAFNNPTQFWVNDAEVSRKNSKSWEESLAASRNPQGAATPIVKENNNISVPKSSTNDEFVKLLKKTQDELKLINCDSKTASGQCDQVKMAEIMTNYQIKYNKLLNSAVNTNPNCKNSDQKKVVIINTKPNAFVPRTNFYPKSMNEIISFSFTTPDSQDAWSAKASIASLTSNNVAVFKIVISECPGEVDSPVDINCSREGYEAPSLSFYGNLSSTSKKIARLCKLKPNTKYFINTVNIPGAAGRCDEVGGCGFSFILN